MYQTKAPCSSQSAGHLKDDIHGLPLRTDSAEGDGVAQRTASHIVHYQIIDVLYGIIASVVDGNQVRMTNLRGDLGLAHEALDEFRMQRWSLRRSPTCTDAL